MLYRPPLLVFLAVSLFESVDLIWSARTTVRSNHLSLSDKQTPHMERPQRSPSNFIQPPTARWTTGGLSPQKSAGNVTKFGGDELEVNYVEAS